MNETSKIDVEGFEGNHKFLAEELLVPNVDKCDLGRVNMFTSHIAQTVILDEPQFPRVFTNFENQVGRYSSSYKKADRNYRVVKILEKNEMNRTFVLEDENGVVDIVDERPAKRITENYGYRIESKLKNKKEKDVIKKDELMYRSTAYDDSLKFKYGSNLKAIYLSYKNLTYEDAIVISESAAERLSYYKTDEITINVNTNDILINLYGDNDNYKSFPDIGEETRDRTLLARRRINYYSVLFDMTAQNLARINHETDAVVFGDGKVVDIEVFCNADMETLEGKEYYNQILKYLVKGNLYYQNLIETLEPYMEAGKYTDEAGYLYKRATDTLNEEVKWRHDKNNFDNIVIKFKVLKKQKLDVGSKITNRFGGKGCISLILPDDQMPMTEDGERAEVVLNPLGIMNRLNPAQLYEQEINFISNQITKRLKKMYEEKKYDGMTDLFFDYIWDINEKQHDSLVDYYNELPEEETMAFWEEIFEKGIFIHQPPFYGNITFDKLRDLYMKYGIKPLKFKGIETPLVIGDIYMLVLKHHPATKFSSRSTSYLNLKGIPSKSNNYKENLQLYSKTPIKLGEMEVTNLFISNRIGEVRRMLSLYSTNEEDRRKAINALAQGNVFDMPRIEEGETKSRTRQVLDVYLQSASLGLKE
jgi:DNA-directed RNA polymerase beta subunit